MEKQFAVSEVRRLSNRIPRSNDEIADAQEALRAFADMLEAQEKAVPVGYITNGDVQELKANRKDKADGVDAIEVLIHSHPFASNHIAIYAHTAPSDTERLADAQNGKWPTDANVEAAVSAFYRNDYLPDFDAMKLALLAAHSAQAQPPAASVTDWTDAQCVAFMATGLRHTEYKNGKSPTVEEIRQGARAAMFSARDASAKQLPDASVPDGLIDALRHQRQIDECGDEVGVSRQAVDEAIAILTMLAAQESPNG